MMEVVNPKKASFMYKTMTFIAALGIVIAMSVGQASTAFSSERATPAETLQFPTFPFHQRILSKRSIFFGWLMRKQPTIVALQPLSIFSFGVSEQQPH